MKPAHDFEEVSKEDMDRRCPGLGDWIDSMIISGALKDTVIHKDSVALQAYYAFASENIGKSAVIVHGFASNPFRMSHIARMYRDSLGYNILLPALRRHGKSGGEAMQMSWRDRFDLLDWSAVAHNVFRDTLQVFHGVSMGASTVMNASGEPTPDYVRGFVEDCGFSNLEDELVFLLGNVYDFPTRSLMNSLDKVVKEDYGWSIREVSCKNQLASCEKPVLFIHGDKDEVVPCGMVWENYNAKSKGRKSIWIGEGSRHARSYENHPAEYTAAVRKFLREQVEVR